MGLNTLLDNDRNVGGGFWSPDLDPSFAGFTEPFVGEDYLTDVTGVTLSVNDPTKYASNPILPASGAHSHTWDGDKLYTSVFKVGSTWHAFYKGADSGGTLTACYAHSSDGLSWTRPNIGRHSTDGNTNNNLIMPESYRLSDALYDPTDRRWYVVIELSPDGTTFGFYVYGSDKPEGPYVLDKTVLTGTGSANDGEARSLVRRPDGRWVAYMRMNTPREIRAFVSDTEAITGAWTDHGLILEAVDADTQFYGMSAWRSGGILYGHALRFNATTDKLWIDLYTSVDGLDWTSRATDWIPVGAAATWDVGMVLNGNTVVVDGDDWHVYYSGSVGTHGSSLLRDSRIGRATVDRNRIGQITGTGTATTVEIVVAEGATMTLTADASGGTLDIEVQNASGTPLTGFAEADFDTISTDVTDHVPTWGGLPLPTDQTVILKFVLSSATLHLYEISDATAEAIVPPPWSPTDLATLELWLDASDDTTITDTAGAVTQWDDKTGNYSFVQATAGNRPTTDASTQNGLNVIDFASDFLTLDGAASLATWMHDGTEHDIVIVFRAGNVADPGALYTLMGSQGSSTSKTGFRLGYEDRAAVPKDDAIIHAVNNSAGGASAPVLHFSADDFWPANTWAALRCRSRPSNGTAANRSLFERNDSTFSNANTLTGTVSGSAPTHVLQLGSDGNSTFTFTGAIAEIIIIRGATLSGAEQAEVQSYLAAKWGL